MSLLIRAVMATTGFIFCAAAPYQLAAASAADAATTASRPNVVILFADDMRGSAINAMSDEEIITPNLDKLVASGTAFPHAYIEGGQGGAVCVASRAMLLTGQHLRNLKRNGSKIPTTVTLMGETFADAGYKTYGIGKWHNNVEALNRCFKDGDEIMLGGMTQSQWQVPLNHYKPDGNYEGTCRPTEGVPKDQPMVCDHLYEGRHSSEIFADAAIKFINGSKGDDPFFLYVAFTAPHDPRDAPKEFVDMYDLEKIKLPPNFLPQHPFDNGHFAGRDEKLLPHPRDPEAVKKEIRDYYAIISHLDSQVGRIMESLEETGNVDNTIVIFIGDNGLAVGQHGLLGKQSLYEHSVNVPMIWQGPGIPKGEKAAARAYLTDIYPTLCEMLKIKTPKTVESDSFIASLQDPKKPHHPDMYYAFRDLQRAVSDGTHKLIEYNVKDTRHTQLFNLKNDPWEMKNLADAPEMQETKLALRKKLVEHERGSKEDAQFWEGF